ncbi:MAG: 4-hydroxy-tetrahydrodipicolinate reductase [Eggerthellaceae bacterium]|nr:4-hydroxy-tetrahydrodipicolinate reductase [Eggerthellaceae bacterium]
MIKVAVSGCLGKMGLTCVDAIDAADDMQLVCGIDMQTSDKAFPIYTSIKDALAAQKIDVLVDFTQADAAKQNIKEVLIHGVDCVVGTTGIKPDELNELALLAKDGAALFYAPNFTTGAVLMMEFSKASAKYFDSCEITEFHHAGKKDAPSGTSIRTAEIISHETGNDGISVTEIAPDASGNRSFVAGDITIHSVRSDDYMACQEVVFSSKGQSLTIRHDSWDRNAYMPGVLLGIRSVSSLSGLVVGLDKIM